MTYGSIELRGSETILQEMINVVVARTNLTDVLPASVLTQILSAAAKSDESLYFQIAKVLDAFSLDQAIGADLTARALDYNSSRLEAQFAVGLVRFTRTPAAAALGALTIPAGTTVASSAGANYNTTTAVVLPNGSATSADVAVISTEAGGHTNTSALGVSVLVSAFSSPESGGLAPTNLAPISGGADSETDKKLRSRLKALIRGLNRTSPDALSATLLANIELTDGRRVASAKVVEDQVDKGLVTVYVDDGSGSTETTTTVTTEALANSAIGGERRFQVLNPPVSITTTAYGTPADIVLTHTPSGNPAVTLTQNVDFYIQTGTGQIILAGALIAGLGAGDDLACSYTHYTDIVQKSQWYLDGRTSDPTSYPGGRAAGARVIVQAPAIFAPAITVQVTVSEGHIATDVRANVRSTLLAYVNGLGVGDDIIISELYDVAMGVSGVKDFVVITPAPSVPPANLAVADNQLARLTNITVQ